MRTPTDFSNEEYRAATAGERFGSGLHDHGIEQEQFKNEEVFRSLKQRHEAEMNDPKTNPTGNTQKDPDDWVSGDEPMTGAQASYLKTLCEQAHSDAFDEKLSKADASKLIDEMREKAGVASH
jgi:hypothetical protein